MFDKFGEFDSAQELCELADNMFNEGDMDGIRALAKENGIDDMTVEFYLDGTEQVFAQPEDAAVGKIEVEAAELEPQDIMVDWVEYIKVSSMEDKELATAVRRKGKTLKGCIGALLKWAFAHQQVVDKDIIKEAGVKGASRITLGMPGRAKANGIIREYYLGGDK